jgi:hypothetical protein
MKFTDLQSNERAVLAALRASAGNCMGTDALGRAMYPTQSPADAASTLNGMRRKGLLYSMQKGPNVAYAPWSISEYGIAVFDGRPDTDPALAPKVATMCAAYGGAVQAASTLGPKMDAATKRAPTKTFIVTRADSPLWTITGDINDATRKAQNLATAEPGEAYRVYELVAVAHMPVPQAQITLL